MARPLDRSSLCPAGLALLTWSEERGLKRDALAELAGVERASLWRWLVGAHVPDLDSAARLERATGIPCSLWSSIPSLRPPEGGPRGT